MKTYECKLRDNVTFYDRKGLLQAIAALKVLDDVVNIHVHLSNEEGDKFYIVLPDNVSYETLVMIDDFLGHIWAFPDELNEQIEKAWEVNG